MDNLYLGSLVQTARSFIGLCIGFSVDINRLPGVDGGDARWSFLSLGHCSGYALLLLVPGGIAIWSRGASSWSLNIDGEVRIQVLIRFSLWMNFVVLLSVKRLCAIIPVGASPWSLGIDCEDTRWSVPVSR
jgi:hypothetical protein